MSLKIKAPDEPVWYKEGLPFQCTGCGKCCTGFPGFVWVSDEEIEAMSQHLKLSVEEFTKQYLWLYEGRLSLKESDKDYDCIFLKDKKICTIYPVRPKQCRTYPFWPKNLENPEAWKAVSTECEGVRSHFPIVDLAAIQAKLS